MLTGNFPDIHGCFIFSGMAIYRTVSAGNTRPRVGGIAPTIEKFKFTFFKSGGSKPPAPRYEIESTFFKSFEGS